MTMVLLRPCFLASSTRTALSLLNSYCSIMRASDVVWHRASCPCLNCQNPSAAKSVAMHSHQLSFVPSFGVSVAISTYTSPLHRKTASWPSAAKAPVTKPSRTNYVSAILSLVKSSTYLRFKLHHLTCIPCHRGCRPWQVRISVLPAGSHLDHQTKEVFNWILLLKGQTLDVFFRNS